MSVLYKSVIFAFILVLISSTFPSGARGAGVSVSAESAVLMEQESGRILFEKDPHEKRRIASITKIMTALLAIESGKMKKDVTISSFAAGTEGSSLYLKPGQKMKLEDLVYGLMLRSGNDAGVAIAEYVGGSVEGFAYLMNKKAEELGMEDSNFTNPHGLDNTRNHYSSAYDMALLTRYAMKFSEYRKITGTKVHKAPNPNENWDYTWRNKNRLLTQLYKYCTGGKTGYTKLAKRTLVTTAEKDGLKLIAVTLNDGDDWDDHKNLYEHAFSDYQLTELLAEGRIGKIKNKVYQGKIYAKNGFQYPLTEEESSQITSKLKLLKPKDDWESGKDIPDIVGKKVFYLDGEEIGSRNIFYGKYHEELKESWIQTWKNVFLTAIGIRHG
ncbi:D-alanyl-D-alanine carboxypeptidase family protein [Peribacillus deserti]|uniref:D-alanyl-D-alanine carboxypeptidase n=1 Tax=Peribacillus deserti TaxID=673318 RepID=A0A2N5M1M4_9BACI|nr:D-alanyl-D-alanine carboxypeptidase family protein [Peribacillus deserti]PLT28284.1 D-alanyl-D-alanine carboxypeptidase [Peribacillus deserti]